MKLMVRMPFLKTVTAIDSKDINKIISSRAAYVITSFVNFDRNSEQKQTFDM